MSIFHLEMIKMKMPHELVKLESVTLDKLLNSVQSLQFFIHKMGTVLPPSQKDFEYKINNE